MSASLVERSRALHEEIEQYQSEAVRLLKAPPKTHKDTVIQNLVVYGMLQKTCDTAARLADTYDDVDGARREEVTSIGGTGPALYSAFYNRLRETKEYHKKFPDAMADDNVGPCESDYYPSVNFTGEEAYGKCLDMHTHYTTFLNLGPQFHGGKQPTKDYLTYLDTFAVFDEIKHYFHISPAYTQYLTDLKAYLLDFFHRAQPLIDIDNKVADAVREFEQLVSSGKVSLTLANNPASTAESDTANSEKAKTDEMKPEGTDSANPFYCNTCRTKFSKQTVFECHLKSKRHKQKLEAQSGMRDRIKNVLSLEHTIFMLSQMLIEVVRDTKDNVTKRQGRTTKEILEEMEKEEEEEEITEEPEPEEEVKQTIDNYPVGWDGKPIPYWLYKLHGLGVEYKCEICGNTSYWGRRAYERHFQEWRHSHGMQCLGVPNTRHFYEITKINDAIMLWRKIQQDRVKEEWRPDQEEEFEDTDGNIYSKKLYEDLVRQGVIQKQ